MDNTNFSVTDKFPAIQSFEYYLIRNNYALQVTFLETCTQLFQPIINYLIINQRIADNRIIIKYLLRKFQHNK